MIEANLIAQAANAMRPGQAMKFNRHEFNYAFGPLASARGGTPEDALLSKCIGSAYGTVRTFRNPLDGSVTITKHESDPGANHCGFVYHVDADRQWMFERVPNGWKRRPETIKPQPENLHDD